MCFFPLEEYIYMVIYILVYQWWVFKVVAMFVGLYTGYNLSEGPPEAKQHSQGGEGKLIWKTEPTQWSKWELSIKSKLKNKVFGLFLFHIFERPTTELLLPYMV